MSDLKSLRAEESSCGGVSSDMGVWKDESGVLGRLRVWKGLAAQVCPDASHVLGLCFPCSSPETVIPQPLFGPSLLSPAATTAWRRLPPPSRMVLLLAGLGPGSKPPLPPASERLLRVSPGGLPVTGREELFHRQGYSSRNPSDDLNLGL